MKLTEGIKYKGRPFHIPNCGRDTLPEFFKERGYTIGAEIGVYKGEFTELFCKAGLKMFAIDPWKAFTGQGKTQNRQERQDFLYGHAQRLLAPYDCTFIRKTSMDALKDFKDESLDFVYIDGDHSFRYIAEDLCEWTKKVKKGGIVSGHDYYYTHPNAHMKVQIKPVIDAYVEVFGIDSFYVFGDLENPKTKNDKPPSWMFFKI